MGSGQSPVLDAVVVGGGISGLSTAFLLQQKGYQVRVLEKAARPGGVVQSVRQGDFLIETGPNSSLETDPRLESFFSQLNIWSERVYALPSARNRYILQRGKLVALPLSPIAFFRTPLFSWKSKLRLLKEPFIPPAPAEVEESLAQFVRRRLGEEFLNYAIDPFVAGVYAGDPEKLSVQAAFPRLWALEQRYGSLLRGTILGARERRRRKERSRTAAPMFSFREGMATPIRALSQELGTALCYNVRLEQIARAENQFLLKGLQNGTPFQVHTRAVIFAIPAYAFAEIQFQFDFPAQRALAQIEYSPVVVVATGFEQHPTRLSLNGFGFLVPRMENRRILGTLWNSSIFPGRAPSGGVLLTTFLGGCRSPDMVSLSDEDITRVVQEELSEILLLEGAPDLVYIQRWPKAIPQYNVGYGAILEALARTEEETPGLFIGGNFRGGISFADCILQAYQRAEQVQRFLQVPAMRLPRSEPAR